jgi:RHS repeat-associated protein
MTVSTSVHSNAFNFMSFLQSGVDPRTGQYTVSINLPDVKTNDLRGPGAPLTLTFNPLNPVDSGFGMGWNLQLSQYTPGNKILSLSTGETFKVTGSDSNSGQLLMEEKKLDSFHFYQDSSTRYRVMHTSGLIEILELHGSAQSQVALPVEIYSPTGHTLTLDYVPFNGTYTLLESISDASGQILLKVKRNDSLLEILLQPFAGADGGPLARFAMTLRGSDKHVTQITLPTEDEASWRFDYRLVFDHLCISMIETPTGGHEDVFYLDAGHQFPEGNGRTPLPRVTRHLTSPGFGQPMVDVRYTYPEEKNFLGFGLSINWTDDGLDNLYKYNGPYEYQCVESLWVGEGAVRSIERTFNRFHLLTSEKTIQNNNVQEVETRYNIQEGASFEAQFTYCQLPKDVETSWSQLDNATRLRSETVSNTYYPNGNLWVQTQASGVVETSTWYPAAGADGCPRDPEGFVRQLKDTTVTPASTIGKAPTLCTRYRYMALPALVGSERENWSVIESETLVQLDASTEQELQRTAYDYINKPDDAFLHGRPQRQTVTRNAKSTNTDYLYSKLASPLFGEAVLQTVETLTGFDDVQKVITLQHSLLNGEPLLNRDDNDVEIRYAYDVLRRVIRETVAPGTDFEASREYGYTLCGSAGQQAEQWLFDVKHVKTITRFDGLNRAVFEERDDADALDAVRDTSGKLLRAGPLRQTYAAVYDVWGNLVEETEYDWLNEQSLALTSTLEYDDWGQQRCVTGPDGVKTFEETDPIGTALWKGPVQRSWQEGTGTTPMISGVTETWLNLFEKPTRIERFGLDDSPISLHQYHYDGLGRTVKEDVSFDEVERLTLYGYDAYDRLIENTLPDTNVVLRSYAEHSSEDLPTSISVNDIVLGTQVFDGLDRMKKSITGGREQIFTYEPGQTQPKTVTTPSGQVIGYDYQPKLGEEPLQRRLPNTVTADYEYDPHNARLLSCNEQGEQLSREYYSTGDVKSEQRAVAGKEYAMQYTYSRLGRLLDYTDVLGQAQSYEYDLQGRLKQTQLGTTTSSFTYDSLGQAATIHTEDSASKQSVSISLEYDEFGRETLRSFDLAGVKQQLSQTYNDVDGLKQRVLSEEGVEQRNEKYVYDPRGRLVNYTCTGPRPPVDPYGKAIASQLFSFDELDNMTLVMTSFVGGFNRARYTYDTQDPTQLLTVTNNHPDYLPATIELNYDADGNLILDEQGRTLNYDALGRLTDVSGPSTHSQYRYDPLDKLSSHISDSGQDQRFYREGELANQLQGEQHNTFIRGGNYLLAEQQGGGAANTLLLAGDEKNTVLSEVKSGEASANSYTAYGHRSAESPPISQLGYNGELSEAGTGWQLLGSGYRVYNPTLMRFHRPDSLSPFGEGGLNAYAYCVGDPVNSTDPTGHSPWGAALRLFRTVYNTASPAAKKIPGALLKNSTSAPARLSKIKSALVDRLEKIAQFEKGSVERADKVVSRLQRASESGDSAKKAYGNAIETLTKTQTKYEQTVKVYKYAQQNIGKVGVTKESARDIKATLAGYQSNLEKTTKRLANDYQAAVRENYAEVQNNVRDKQKPDRQDWHS